MRRAAAFCLTLAMMILVAHCAFARGGARPQTGNTRGGLILKRVGYVSSYAPAKTDKWGQGSRLVGAYHRGHEWRPYQRAGHLGEASAVSSSPYARYFLSDEPNRYLSSGDLFAPW